MRRRSAKQSTCIGRITVSTTTINHFDWDKLVASRSAYIDRIPLPLTTTLLVKIKLVFIKGFARFVDAHTVEVNGETITADHI